MATELISHLDSRSGSSSPPQASPIARTAVWSRAANNPDAASSKATEDRSGADAGTRKTSNDRAKVSHHCQVYAGVHFRYRSLVSGSEPVPGRPR